ncbi:branched-chain amino acid ABC transporter permease [Thermodesulfobacteriota bacterium]
MKLSFILINGLMIGGTYALLAAGFALVFGVANILNFAHTALYMLTAFFLYIFMVNLGLPLLLAALLAIIVPTVIAMLFYRFFIYRVKEHKFAVIILTVSLVIIIEEVLLKVFGTDLRGIEPFIPGFIEIAGTRVSYQHVITILACIVILIALWLLLSKTRMGNAIRAVSQDGEIAGLMGINVGRIQVMTVGLSVVLAGIAAVVVAPLASLDPYMWVNPVIIILAAVVLGGMGNIKGSVYGAFILGYIEVMVVTLVPQGSFLRGVVSLLAMVLVLIIRPEGLFGVVFEEERL